MVASTVVPVALFLGGIGIMVWSVEAFVENVAETAVGIGVWTFLLMVVLGASTSRTRCSASRPPRAAFRTWRWALPRLARAGARRAVPGKVGRFEGVVLLAVYAGYWVANYARTPNYA